MTSLPGLNYATPLGITDLEHLESVYTEEFLARTLAAIGSYRAAGANYGILAETDPAVATATTEPLFVARNATNRSSSAEYLEPQVDLKNR